ncbi:MAG: hypothetical protein NWF14_02510 [Candidatus Bathyarchaeota archaeon]|nr:hypothetical protein [Candidatus Bathyarchaeota archaeon]
MLANKRSIFDVARDVLETAGNGANVTEIIHNANLNWKLAYEILYRLLTQGLIRRQRRTRTYKTTTKGREILTVFKQLETPLKMKYQSLT